MASLDKNAKEPTVTDVVRIRYTALATKMLEDGSTTSFSCGSNNAKACGNDNIKSRSIYTDGNKDGKNIISQGLYSESEFEGISVTTARVSLGCGNPTALLQLNLGDIVLDLGSGGGLDVLLSARRVGSAGFVYGLDMNDAMLELARRNVSEASVTNVKFLKGDIAAIPLPATSVTAIISNCVINLAQDKGAVLREAFRVLKPGGRLAVSDIVLHGGIPAQLPDTLELRRELSSWAGCIAGVWTGTEYQTGLTNAGFMDIELVPTRRYTLEDLCEPLPEWTDRLGKQLTSQIIASFASTFVRATKPISKN